LAKSVGERKTPVKNFARDAVVIEPDPFMWEEMEKAIREMAHAIEVIDLLRKLSGKSPLLAR
jgi:hypothetical protein